MKRRKFIELSTIGAFIASWFKPKKLNLDDYTPLTGRGIATNEGMQLGEHWQPIDLQNIATKSVTQYKAHIILVNDYQHKVLELNL